MRPQAEHQIGAVKFYYGALKAVACGLTTRKCGRATSVERVIDGGQSMTKSESPALNGHSGAKDARAANELVILTYLGVLGDGDSHTSGGRSLSG